MNYENMREQKWIQSVTAATIFDDAGDAELWRRLASVNKITMTNWVLYGDASAALVSCCRRLGFGHIVADGKQFCDIRTKVLDLTATHYFVKCFQHSVDVVISHGNGLDKAKETQTFWPHLQNGRQKTHQDRNARNGERQQATRKTGKEVVRRHCRLVWMLTSRGSSAGKRPTIVEKNHWSQRLTWAMSWWWFHTKQISIMQIKSMSNHIKSKFHWYVHMSSTAQLHGVPTMLRTRSYWNGFKEGLLAWYRN